MAQAADPEGSIQQDAPDVETRLLLRLSLALDVCYHGLIDPPAPYDATRCADATFVRPLLSGVLSHRRGPSPDRRDGRSPASRRAESRARSRLLPSRRSP